MTFSQIAPLSGWLAQSFHLKHRWGATILYMLLNLLIPSERWNVLFVSALILCGHITGATFTFSQNAHLSILLVRFLSWVKFCIKTLQTYHVGLHGRNRIDLDQFQFRINASLFCLLISNFLVPKMRIFPALLRPNKHISHDITIIDTAILLDSHRIAEIGVGILIVVE